MDLLLIYGLVDLLNKVSQTEYDLLALKEDVCNKIDEVVEND